MCTGALLHGSSCSSTERVVVALTWAQGNLDLRSGLPPRSCVVAAFLVTLTARQDSWRRCQERLLKTSGGSFQQWLHLLKVTETDSCVCVCVCGDCRLVAHARAFLMHICMILGCNPDTGGVLVVCRSLYLFFH